ncbi:MAG: hypothetical protein ASARMPRED_004497 [Alectoria sarmentosa]|nr:MAG: hypothetical protein ASARMPRED_004497 [Alectoria sarmentosa]
MKHVPPSARPPSRESLKAISYNDTVAAKPPIPITVATPPSRSSNRGVNSLRRPKASNQRLSPRTARSNVQDDARRDSGLAPSSSTTRDSRTTLGTDVESTTSIKHSPSIPSFLANDVAPFPKSNTTGGEESRSKEHTELPAIPQLPFMSILTEIPSGSFEDLTLPGQLAFSKRGSMLIGGKKANKGHGRNASNGRLIGSRRTLSKDLMSPSPSLPTRVLSANDEALSHNVRSMYEGGAEEDSSRAAGLHRRMGNGPIEEQESSIRQVSNPSLCPANTPQITMNGEVAYRVPSQAETTTSKRSSVIAREATELAGGIEDWEDLNGGDVDRYGFIVPRKPSSQASSLKSYKPTSPEIPRIQRMSTLLQVASDAPRRQHSTIRGKKTPLAKSPASSAEMPSSSTIVRPNSSQSSYRAITGNRSRIRSAANRLPHNKDRKCIDEAGDMLTLPPGLADIAENEEDNRVADELKRRECEREDKWRKMAKIVRNKNGGGMVFEFDTKSPKVIERTWKGIPDRWRATAWHAFLTASAKKRRDSPSDDELIAVFKKLLTQGSPDDVQIDIDVPRTINSHIMFRRRYRGGQRLLFRVLHCLSIYFPDTGYVQGMAALAATLLCYFDEEITFVMLVRLWQLRGLERLYQSGFEGLMQALEEFEKDWLGKGEVAAKLDEYNISPTAYGTRWYLTLFNYSIPFPAQLRVWDVFMLLGDADPSALSASPPSFNGGLDVLHAASAALIDGTREILLDSDFENAMKVLTSWIPVKDEEMLMRVARVEWKTKRRKP